MKIAPYELRSSTSNKRLKEIIFNNQMEEFCYYLQNRLYLNRLNDIKDPQYIIV